MHLLEYVFAGLIIFFVIYFYLRDKGYFKPKEHSPSTQQTPPLRIQAYERLTIFVDRLNPASLVIRHHIHGQSARELQSIMLAEIRSEFQHNIAQQLYVSSEAWLNVKRLKDDTVMLISQSVGAISDPDTAPAAELGKIILNHLKVLDTNPYDEASSILQQDVERLF